jgi:hypothetical protein
LVWAELRPTFDAELAKCTDANFEFSALAGAYAPQILYLSEEWFDMNFPKMFPLGFPRNCLAALDGLAYAPASAAVYKALVDKGVLDWALHQELKGQHTQENLMQRIALAYFWDQEQLDQPRFKFLFEARQIDALLVLSRYFWSVHSEKLSALLAVAPYVSIDYNMDQFIEELERLADASPVQVSKVLGRMLQATTPVFDYEDKLKRLLTKLLRHSDTAAAIQYAEGLVGKLPGMTEFFGQMKTALGSGS